MGLIEENPLSIFVKPFIIFKKELHSLRRADELPAAIVVFDVDGLKLINDVLGYAAGDRLIEAFNEILKNSFRTGDVVARIGEDEFAVIMRGCDEKYVDSAINRVMKKIEEFNSKNEDLYLSVSVGYAVKRSLDQDPFKVFNEATCHMYSNKLLKRQAIKNAIASLITKKLNELWAMRENRINRLLKLAEAFGEKLGLSQEEKEKIYLLCQYHDIGTIALPRDLLHKGGRLAQEERKMWQKHCTIGYKLAIAVPKISCIADLILSHHEHYDGSGYPMKLKGKEIPYLARAFAIIEAYEAMTRKRPYRQPLKHEEAIMELKRLAGSQFDPNLVMAFCEMGKII